MSPAYGLPLVTLVVGLSVGFIVGWKAALRRALRKMDEIEREMKDDETDHVALEDLVKMAQARRTCEAGRGLKFTRLIPPDEGQA